MKKKRRRMQPEEALCSGQEAPRFGHHKLHIPSCTRKGYIWPSRVGLHTYQQSPSGY
ncbi:hypothetical protein XENTR_v10014502 [Xenopus tropicalis]|nr:hypothetical protein XENTR_v10014502 [Xenopus tropicalis]